MPRIYLCAVQFVSIGIALVALFFAYRATMISSRALAISRAARREVLQRSPAEPEPEPEREPGPRLSVSVEPGPDHDVAKDGTIWTTGHEFLASLIVIVTNDGELPSGRTHVDVWIPRAEAGEPWWAEETDGAPSPGLPQAVPDEVRLHLGGAPPFETMRLSRVLDGIATGVPHRLGMRAHFEVNPGRNQFPIDVVVRAEDTEDEAKHREVLRIARRY
jgi:hypothetical protein